MRKTFKYRLYPTKSQSHLLGHTLDECRWLYNQTLEYRQRAWKEHQESISLYDTNRLLPAWKQERPSLTRVYSQVFLNVQMRVDLAFKAFFRRVKAGEQPGYPRFRGEGRYDSFTYTQFGFGLKDGKLHLAKIGDIGIVLHRPLEGKVKTLTIRRTPTGKWFACFSCEVELQPLLENAESVGIDVGLTAFATLSTGEKIANPHFFRTDEKALAKAQRKLSKAVKGTPERHKRRKVVAHIHERTANRRRNFAHQVSRQIVNRFGLIFVEDLQVSRMVHNHCLAKSIMDAAWSEFFTFLGYKAAWAASRTFAPQNPAYTTQDCCRCGHRQVMPLSERVFNCPCCGNAMDRDHNSACNLQTRGLASLAASAA